MSWIVSCMSVPVTGIEFVSWEVGCFSWSLEGLCFVLFCLLLHALLAFSSAFFLASFPFSLRLFNFSLFFFSFSFCFFSSFPLKSMSPSALVNTHEPVILALIVSCARGYMNILNEMTLTQWVPVPSVETEVEGVLDTALG